MTTQTEALKMALEALDQLTNVADTFSVSGVYLNEEVWAKKCLSDAYFAITAIKEALAQQSNEQVEFDDFELLPVDPTTEMKNAAINVELFDHDTGKDYLLSWEEAEQIYSAMLNAAPAHPPVPTAQPKDQETLAYREAARLAEWLFKKHFSQEEHYASGRVVWGLCDSTAGVISQIDNMVCQLVKPKEPEQ